MKEFNFYRIHFMVDYPFSQHFDKNEILKKIKNQKVEEKIEKLETGIVDPKWISLKLRNDLIEILKNFEK
jgi:hypothetical protein